MSDYYDYGPLQTWEVTWNSGHVERFQGHQCLIDSDLFDGLVPGGRRGTKRVQIHGEFDGHWRLVMAAPEPDIRTVRLVTDGGPVPFKDQTGEAP